MTYARYTMSKMKKYQYVIKLQAASKIRSFYRHVHLKYRHTYSSDDMRKHISEYVDSMYLIEQSLLRRRPTLQRWKEQGWHMAHAGHWYYAYTINDDTVTIEDARHEQNMHEDK